MPRNERNCQIRMSPALWNLIGEIAQELGHSDARGRHSAVIREMVASAAAKWRHSPYVCRSARHTIYVTGEGNVFARHVQILRLNSQREKLPCFIEMKPEKRVYDHKGRHRNNAIEHQWFLDQWLLNYFGVWSGKKDADDLEAFQQQPLSFSVDESGTTLKSADLAVHAVGGRFLTREIVIGLRDYVQWKQPDTPIFDRVDIPIDIPTSNLGICVVVDLDLFGGMDIEEDQLANLALEFRNRESARFEGKEVALYPEIGIEERYGRSPDDDGADEALAKVRRLRQRILFLLDNAKGAGKFVNDKAKLDINKSLQLPQRFLFYFLKWSSPHLGIEVCIRWEKPVKK